jgi:hypothetical protein
MTCQYLILYGALDFWPDFRVSLPLVISFCYMPLLNSVKRNVYQFVHGEME